MGKSAMRASWTKYYIISKRRESFEIGNVGQFIRWKHIDKTFDETFMMLRKIFFHFLDKDMMRKNCYYNDKNKTGICRSNMIPSQEKACGVEIGKNRIAIKMVPDLEDITYEKRLKDATDNTKILH